MEKALKDLNIVEQVAESAVVVALAVHGALLCVVIVSSLLGNALQ